MLHTHKLAVTSLVSPENLWFKSDSQTDGQTRNDYSVTRKKLPNVYKSCPKMVTLER